VAELVAVAHRSNKWHEYFMGWVSCLSSNQQCQSTEGKYADVWHFCEICIENAVVYMNYFKCWLHSSAVERRS